MLGYDLFPLKAWRGYGAPPLAHTHAHCRFRLVMRCAGGIAVHMNNATGPVAKTFPSTPPKPSALLITLIQKEDHLPHSMLQLINPQSLTERRSQARAAFSPGRCQHRASEGIYIYIYTLPKAPLNPPLFFRGEPINLKSNFSQCNNKKGKGQPALAVGNSTKE